MHVQRNTETRSCNQCCCWKAISITYSENVFIALGIQNTICMRSIVVCVLLGSTVSFNTISLTAWFSAKRAIKMKFLFWFSPQILPETFIILRKIERDMIKIYTVLHVNYPLFLSYFHETWIFSTDIRKILTYKISWKSVRWEPSSIWTDGQTDRRTDVTTLIVTFRNSANAPNYWKFCLY